MAVTLLVSEFQKCLIVTYLCICDGKPKDSLLLF